MKPLIILALTISSLCLLTSCAHVSSENISSGFFIRRTHSGLSWEAGSDSQELYYRGTNGSQRRVWEYVTTACAGNGSAVFIGWREEDNGPSGSAYFAVKENGPVVAIKNATLEYAARKIGIQSEEYLKQYGVYELSAKDKGVRFEFTFDMGVNQPHLFVDLTWDEISEIVDGVIKTGKPHKDKVSGLTYLE